MGTHNPSVAHTVAKERRKGLLPPVGRFAAKHLRNLLAAHPKPTNPIHEPLSVFKHSSPDGRYFGVLLNHDDLLRQRLRYGSEPNDTAATERLNHTGTTNR